MSSAFSPFLLSPSIANPFTDSALVGDPQDKARGPALYKAHKNNQTELDDDPSARAFDREKDIAGGLQLNSTQRRDMVKKATDFSSRFSSARYL